MNLTSTNSTTVRDHHSISLRAAFSALSGRAAGRSESCQKGSRDGRARPDESVTGRKPHHVCGAGIDCSGDAGFHVLDAKTFDATVSNVSAKRPRAQSIVSEKLWRPQRRIQRFGLQSFGRHPATRGRQASPSNPRLKTLDTPVSNVFGPSARPTGIVRASRESKSAKCTENRPVRPRPACTAACSPLRYGLAEFSKDFRGDAAA